MYVFPGQFVFLTDQYYSDFGDKNISLGHNPSGSNEKSGRPCFFAFPDPSDPKISWVVPVSSQYQKYEAIVNQKIRKRGFCNTIILGELNGHSTAFLIQNMCPVTENYIASVYLHHGTTPVQIDQRTSWRIMRDAKRILEKTKAGVPNLLYADVRSIYVNAILIVGHSDNEKVYHQHHVPCKIETTLYARRERYGSGDVTLLTNPGSICFR